MMQDEGIGVRVVEVLQEEADRFPRADFKDLGAGGLSLLHAAREYDKLIAIDCARMGEAPGTLKRFEPGEVSSTKEASGRSLHEADVLQVIHIARRTGDAPREVVFFGIEPAAVDFGEGLSAPLRDKLDEYATAVKRELESSQRSSSR